MNNDLFSGLGFNEVNYLVGSLATKIELSKKAMAQGPLGKSSISRAQAALGIQA